jgi:hypothetical protein
MAEYEVIDSDALPEVEGYQAPFCTSSGGVRSRFRAPEDFGQFVCYADLDTGAEVAWDDTHGDEGVFVVSGEVEVSGAGTGDGVVGAKGAVIVEAGAPARLMAKVPTRLLHLGSTVAGAMTESTIGPPSGDAPTVHVYGPEGKAGRDYGALGNVFYADSYCDGCRISLFRVTGHEPYVGTSHLHTVHEMITVTEGELQVGRDTAGPLVTLAIPANRRYGFRTKGPWEFVNFRLDASWYVLGPGSEPVREGIGAGAGAS